MLLREFTEDDAPAFVVYHADPRSAELDSPEEATPEHAGELLRLFSAWALERPRQSYQLAISDRRSPRELLGCCRLRGCGSGSERAELGIHTEWELTRDRARDLAAS